VERPHQTTIDPLDRAIIDRLTHDGRATFGEIGRLVGLSAPAVKRRVDRLEARRVIVGYQAVVDHSQLERPLEAFTELRFTGDARVDEIAAIGQGLDEVQAVFTMAGDPDALVWLRVRDVHDLKRVVDKLRGSGHVSGTKTMIVLGSTNQSPNAPRRAPTERRL
jgi:Lrp/AsnC family leucine-responsive transcriptional regulator